MWIAVANTIYFLDLPWRQVFMRVEAPAPFEQSLAAENLMEPGDASSKSIVYVEQSRVVIRQLVRQCYQVQSFFRCLAPTLLHGSKHFHGPLCPHRPLP